MVAPDKTTVLVITGPLDPDDVLTLCERLRALLEGSDIEVVDCDVTALDEPDAVTIEALARLQLTARRMGRSIQLVQPCPQLQDLLALTGLGDVLPLSPGTDPASGPPPA